MTLHAYHAVVWIDHREARIFHLNREESEKQIMHPDHPTHQVHHKARSVGSGHARVDHEFLHEVAETLSDAGAILITGPANAKLDLMKHITDHHPQLASHVRGVETVDHPSDGQLLAHARNFFKADDKMHTL